MNVPRKFVRNIRAILHDCHVHGVAAANTRFKTVDRKQRLGQPPNVISHVAGKLDYLRMIRRSDDPLYVKLAVAAHTACSLYPAGISVFGNAAKVVDLLKTAVWVVLGLDHNGTEVVQGSAFSLEGVGIVSARHNFNNPANGFPVARWEIRMGSDAKTAFAVTGIHDDPALDLTVLQANVDLVLTRLRLRPTRCRSLESKAGLVCGLGLGGTERLQPSTGDALAPSVIF